MAAQDRKNAGMQRNAFLNQLRQGRVNGAWLFEGRDDYLMRGALKEVRAQLLPAGLAEMNETLLSAPSTDGLIAACETLPFLADQRLVIVTEQAGFTGRAEADERLTAYLPKVPPTCLLLFLCRGDADRRKKLTKAMMDAKRMVSFSPMEGPELQDWIIASFAEQGKRCGAAQARELQMIAGTEAQRLTGEIAKLSAMAGESAEISSELIARGATPMPEYTVFQMVDAVVAGQRQAAFEEMRTLLRNGESRLGILALLLRQYRMLQHLKIFQHERVPASEWEERLGMRGRGFAVDKYRRQAQNLSAGAVRRAVNLCLETEYRVKSGQIAEDGCLEAVMLRLLQDK